MTDENLFLYFFTKLKTYYLSFISTYMGSLDSTEKARVALSYASSTSYTFLMLSRLLTYIHNSNCMQPKVLFLFIPSTCII